MDVRYAGMARRRGNRHKNEIAAKGLCAVTELEIDDESAMRDAEPSERRRLSAKLKNADQRRISGDLSRNIEFKNDELVVVFQPLAQQIRREALSAYRRRKRRYHCHGDGRLPFARFCASCGAPQRVAQRRNDPIHLLYKFLYCVVGV